MSSVLERMERQAVILERERRLDAHDLDFLREYEEIQWRDKLRALRHSGEPQASFLTGTNVELIYASVAAGTAKNTFTTELQLNDTANFGVQAHLPPDFWLPNRSQIGRGIKVVARGILSVVAATTPTFTFAVRLGASGNITTTPLVLGSAALTTVSGVAGAGWTLDGDVILEAIAAAGTNSTVRGVGEFRSGGTANKNDALWGAAATPGTVATLDTTITNYINVNVACGTSNVGNTITLQQLLVFGLN